MSMDDWMLPPGFEQPNGPQPVVPRGPTVADAYRMGHLAGMENYQEPPANFWSEVDRQKPRETVGSMLFPDQAPIPAGPELQREQFLADMRRPQGRGRPGAPVSMEPTAARASPAVAREMVDALVPQSATDVALMGLGGPLGRGVKAGGLALGGLLDSADPAEAGTASKIKKALGAGKAATREMSPAAKMSAIAEQESYNVPPSYVAEERTKKYAPTFQMGTVVNAGVEAPTNRMIQTVRDPYRMMFPGVYGNPREIAEEAARHVVPENPAMKQLFGVTRGDLDAMVKGRVGNEAPVVPPAGPRSRGAVSADNIMTSRNEQRLNDILYEGGRHPGIKHADAWYIMDPVYQRLEQMFGPEEAVKRYRHLNAMTGMASPGSDVLTEVQRGTGAHWLEQQKRFGDFLEYGGLPETLAKKHKKGAVSREMLGDQFPADMRYMIGHPYHSTAQADPMERYLRTGKTFNTGPKVPLYIQASGTPYTGFQSVSPVGDAHFSRGVGLTDTRKGPTDVQGSFSVSESQTLQPWWQQKIAAQHGIESVPAQARLWTVLGPQTGVDSPLGQGKLELLSQQIMKAAHRLGISPERARDLILSGGAGAGALMMAAPGLQQSMGGAAALDQYQ